MTAQDSGGLHASLSLTALGLQGFGLGLEDARLSGAQ